jgi:hypothetical protein
VRVSSRRIEYTDPTQHNAGNVARSHAAIVGIWLMAVAIVLPTWKRKDSKRWQRVADGSPVPGVGRWWKSQAAATIYHAHAALISAIDAGDRMTFARVVEELLD